MPHQNKQFVIIFIVALVTGASTSSDDFNEVQLHQAVNFLYYRNGAHAKLQKFVEVAANMLIKANLPEELYHDSEPDSWVDMNHPLLAPQWIGRIDIEKLLSRNSSAISQDELPHFVVALIHTCAKHNLFYLYVPEDQVQRVKSIFQEQVVDSCDKYLRGMDMNVYTVNQGPVLDQLPSEEQLSSMFGFYLGEAVYHLCERILWHRPTILDNLEEAYKRGLEPLELSA